MASPQTVAPNDLSQFALLVGIDWADRKHDVAVHSVGSNAHERRQVDQRPEALDDWIMDLRRRFDGSIAVAVELSRGPLINALMKYDFVTIFPIPPARLANYRRAFVSSGAKDDPTDAELILDYLRKHADVLRPWQPDDEQTRELDMLSRNRRALVDHHTKLGNKLTNALKLYFPQILDWLADVRTPLACDLLQRWSTLEELQRAKPNSIRKFFLDHHGRDPDRVERLIEQLPSACPLTTDRAVISATVLLVQALVRELKGLAKSIREIDGRIRELFDTHPDAPIFRALPGAGAAMAPRLLSAFGTDRARFSSAAEVGTYAGIAPVTRRSGKSATVHRRYACPTFVRQTFHEFAGLSIRWCAWARAYYDQQRERGAQHHAAVRALAFKWIRVIYACWRDRVPYDDERYTQALRDAGSPLANALPDCGESAGS